MLGCHWPVKGSDGAVWESYVRDGTAADKTTMTSDPAATSSAPDRYSMCWHLWRKRRIFRVRTGLFLSGCGPCRTVWTPIRDAHLHNPSI